MNYEQYRKHVAPLVGDDLSVQAKNISNLDEVPEELMALVSFYLAAEERLIDELKARKIINP